MHCYTYLLLLCSAAACCCLLLPAVILWYISGMLLFVMVGDAIYMCVNCVIVVVN